MHKSFQDSKMELAISSNRCKANCIQQSHLVNCIAINCNQEGENNDFARMKELHATKRGWWKPKCNVRYPLVLQNSKCIYNLDPFRIFDHGGSRWGFLSKYFVLGGKSEGSKWICQQEQRENTQTQQMTLSSKNKRKTLKNNKNI